MAHEDQTILAIGILGLLAYFFRNQLKALLNQLSSAQHGQSTAGSPIALGQLELRTGAGGNVQIKSPVFGPNANFSGGSESYALDEFFANPVNRTIVTPDGSYQLLPGGNYLTAGGLIGTRGAYEGIRF